MQEHAQQEPEATRTEETSHGGAEMVVLGTAIAGYLAAAALLAAAKLTAGRSRFLHSVSWDREAELYGALVMCALGALAATAALRQRKDPLPLALLSSVLGAFAAAVVFQLQLSPYESLAFVVLLVPTSVAPPVFFLAAGTSLRAAIAGAALAGVTAGAIGLGMVLPALRMELAIWSMPEPATVEEWAEFHDLAIRVAGPASSEAWFSGAFITRYLTSETVVTELADRVALGLHAVRHDTDLTDFRAAEHMLAVSLYLKDAGHMLEACEIFVVSEGDPETMCDRWRGAAGE